MFQLLQKRYQKAKSGLSLSLIKERTEVIEALQEWIQKGSGAEDVLDDGQLYDTFKSFNSDLMREEGPPSSQRDSTDVKIRGAWEDLGRAKENLIALFATHIKRPPIKRPIGGPYEVTGERFERGISTDPPDIDRLSPEELVNAIDGMINAAFRNVTEEVRVRDHSTSDLSANIITGHPLCL